MEKSIQTHRSKQSITIDMISSIWAHNPNFNAKPREEQTKETWHKNPKHVDLNIKACRNIDLSTKQGIKHNNQEI